MQTLSLTLLLAAFGIGLTHTILGPDHYLPFLMLSRSRRWSRARTLAITALCGLGHVASSLVLATAGIALGLGVARIEAVEIGRGDLAAWLLVAFGAAYGLWGVRQALRRRGELEVHEHEAHVHVHWHGAHGHSHEHEPDRTNFWILFTLFVLGPCEPLIPLFVIPASRGDWFLAAQTAVVFGTVTIGSMLAVTALGLAGLQRLPLGPLERWSHAMAGAVIAASGLSVIFLGL
jgi:nickel/cobalt transporter (NicO) family protein